MENPEHFRPSTNLVGVPSSIQSSLGAQVGGAHYKSRNIQPVEYAYANSLDFFEGSVVKYITRWRDKGGISDLEKAKHFIEMLIELETASYQSRT